MRQAEGPEYQTPKSHVYHWAMPGQAILPAPSPALPDEEFIVTAACFESSASRPLFSAELHAGLS